jgi:hypothetical protein
MVVSTPPGRSPQAFNLGASRFLLKPVYDAALYLNEWCLATSSLLRRRKRAALS